MDQPTGSGFVVKVLATRIASIIITVAGVVAAIYGLSAWIDYRVEALISDDRFVQKLSRNLRPFVIFDSRSSIIYDQGAMDQIDRIQVDTSRSEGNLVVRRIIVSPKHFLLSPPLLDCIDLTLNIYQPTRGQKFDWVYNLAEETISGPNVIRFRMEILR
jgi:hypothetical protein